MSLRGSLTLECDRPRCHAELVIDADEVTPVDTPHGLVMGLSASGWHVTDDGELICPQCASPEDRDEAYERAAARDRADGFSRTGGKDWT